MEPPNGKDKGGTTLKCSYSLNVPMHCGTMNWAAGRLLGWGEKE